MKIKFFHAGGNNSKNHKRPSFKALVVMGVMAAALSGCATSGRPISDDEYNRFQKRIEKENEQRRIDKMTRIPTRQEIIDEMKRRKALPRP